MTNNPSEGCLYVVGTPIGHLDDFTVRGVKVLQEVDYVAAEDTRQSRKLLNHYQISKKLISLHEHNEDHKKKSIIQDIRQGMSVALISDAGTPTISDPGYPLVRAAIDNDIMVVPIPGPSAIVTALSASGLPTDRFQFLGFLPIKSGKKEKLLQSLASSPSTLIFYESPHRLVKTCQMILNVLGDRSVVMAREMTKRFEEFVRQPVSELLTHLESHPPRGEITLLVMGQKDK
jgi:16S rRNA (cytidine1402-2'-O)-methyltransferase